MSIHNDYIQLNPNDVCSSTSNETVTGGTPNITTALKDFFPELTQQDLAEYSEVYPESDYDSVSQWQQVATGEPELICGVGCQTQADGCIMKRIADVCLAQYHGISIRPKIGRAHV